MEDLGANKNKSSNDKNVNSNIENNGNQNNNKGGGLPCHNIPRQIVHIATPQRNTRQLKMKTWLLQILYVNPFIGLDHEYPYTHLTKFYELSGTLRAVEEEKTLFMRLSPYSLLGKEK